MTASPVASRSPAASPTTTSPVLTPIRCSERDTEVALELLVETARRSRIPEAARSARKRIVLVQLRDAEHGHDRVADELLDGATMRLEHRAHLVEVAGHHPPQRLGVEPLAQRCRPAQVGEENGDGLAGLGPGWRLGSEHSATAAAEAEPVRILVSTARAGDHTGRVGQALCALVVPARGGAEPPLCIIR